MERGRERRKERGQGKSSTGGNSWGNKAVLGELGDCVCVFLVLSGIRKEGESSREVYV